MREDVIKNSIYFNHDRIHDLFKSHGIPSSDKNQILKYCAEENLSEKLTLLRIAKLFEVEPEFFNLNSFDSDSNDNQADVSNNHPSDEMKSAPVVYRPHIYSSIESWAEKLISDKQQGFQPQIIFVGAEIESPNLSKERDEEKTRFCCNGMLIFVELTKKLKTNMVCRVYHASKLPSWKEALWLVEKALLPYRGIMLESGPYWALSQQATLPVQALKYGRYWSLPLCVDLEDGEIQQRSDNFTQSGKAKSERALSFYAEKLRYTIPRATPQVIDLECPLI